MLRIVRLALAAATAATLFAVPAAAQTKPVIRLGYVCGGMNAMIAQLGLNDGAYERAGLTVEKFCFPAGAPAIQALIGNSIDVFPGSAEHALRAQSRGINVKIFGCLQDSIGYALITKADSKVKTLADLKGETVAVTAPKSLSDTGLRRGLTAAGLDGDRDLTIISAGSGATMLAALETNRAVAGMVSAPELQRLTESKAYRVVYDPTFEYAGIVVMARSEFVNANKAAMQTFFRVMGNEAALARTNVPAAAAAMNHEFPDVSPSVMQQAVRDQSRAVPVGFAVPRRGLQDVDDIEVRDKSIPAPVPFEQVVDTTLVVK